ncbi:hypothetical protein M1D97_12900 [Kushneria sp. AK178]
MIMTASAPSAIPTTALCSPSPLLAGAITVTVLPDRAGHEALIDHSFCLGYIPNGTDTLACPVEGPDRVGSRAGLATAIAFLNEYRQNRLVSRQRVFTSHAACNVITAQAGAGKRRKARAVTRDLLQRGSDMNDHNNNSWPFRQQ